MNGRGTEVALSQVSRGTCSGEREEMTVLHERMNAIERTACLIAGMAVGAVFITILVF